MLVSCIIPYYNEKNRIHEVLESIREVTTINEVLLIDDGSTDGGVIFSDQRARHFRMEKNKGKAEAMRLGFTESTGDIIVFLDADLSGITAENINSLIFPILNGNADISISQREYFSFFDVVSGERAMKKRHWDSFFRIEKFERNAAEIMMNRFIMLKELRVKMIDWNNVHQDYKSNKIGFFKGMWKDIRYVTDWMNQMGYLNFSTTYLFFWINILMGRPKFLTVAYKTIYAKKFKYLQEFEIH